VEGTGQIRVLLPVMIVVAISNYFAYLIHKDGVYDVILKIKGFPYLEPAENKQSYDIFQVREIMCSPVVTVPEKERAIDLVRLLRSSPHNGFPVVDKQERFIGLVSRKQIVALIECGIFQKSNPDNDRSSGTTLDADLLHRPKTGFGAAYQSLMHWALHVKDDRYSEDLPNANTPEVGSLDDDEFGENSFLLHVQKILKDVGRKFETSNPTENTSFNKLESRTSFLHPSAMNKMTSTEKRINLGGDDTMPVMIAENLRFEVAAIPADDVHQHGRMDKLITSPNDSHGNPKDSVASTDSTDPSTSLLNTSVQSAPTGFARVGQDPVEGNVVISWLHPAHDCDVVNLKAVMNQGTYCVPDHFPVSKAYQLFTKLGLRWIVVVGGESGGEVVGILTRATLLNSHICHQTGIDMSSFE
jgi:CBS domain-containing protein